MKTKSKIKRNKFLFVILFSLMVVGYFHSIPQASAQINQSTDYNQYSGIILDSKTKKPLEFASVVVNNTNISTISNIDGEFSLKVPKNYTDKSITITYLGFNNRVIPLSTINSDKFIIKLEESFEKLPDVNLITKDPIFIINKMMDNRKKNYFGDQVIMTAFYRESIKKKKKYASLSEAVVDIYKFPYESNSKDYVKLYKTRKSTDYRRIDTLVIKLQGGPYNNLNMDLIKNQNLFFANDIFDIYNFTFEKVISMNNKTVYVINFIQKGSVVEPFYQGKLYIEAQTYALTKAVFSLNLQNLHKASKYFVKKKPAKADVIPTNTKYIVDYRLSNGKWYFGYSRIELSFKIDWNKKLFNSQYHLTIEMAVTDWKINKNNTSLKNKERLKTNIILNDKAKGFSDPEFWGEYNVIEPDKTIENAIKKIQRQLNR